MKTFSKIFCFLLIFLFPPLFGVGSLSAQTYPVQVNVHALPPYSNQLSDYYTTSREKLVVSLLNRDQNRPNLDVELQMTISTANGLIIRNKPGMFYPTITLMQGVLTRLTQDDLAPYMQPQNITHQGYMNQGKLPDGMVEFTFQAIEKYTRKPVSLPATARVWLAAQKPPLLSLPQNGEFVAFREPLNMRFQWTPQHRNISQVEYLFELRELPNTGAAPQSAFLYSPVIHQERLVFTSLMYTPMMPPLDPDKTYGWRVRAVAKDGVDEINMFENNGFSEIWFFKTQVNCLCPTNVKATVNDRAIDLSWTPASGNSAYEVQYRSKTAVSEEWQTVTSTEPKATLKSLPRNTTYEYRIGGVCAQGKPPVFTEIGEARIEARDLSNCGVAPVVDLSNQEPLPELKVGDVVTVGGDFPMTVTLVKGGSNGVFRGEGWQPINWVFESKLAVEFDDLMINTDYRQIGGLVRGKYDKSKSQISDFDETEKIGNNTRNGVVMTDVELDFVIPENPIFEYNAETGELMVFGTDGSEPLVAEMSQNGGKTVFPIIIADKEGNLYKIEGDVSNMPDSPGEDLADNVSIDSNGAVKVEETKKEEKEFKLTDLKAIDRNNTKRVAKARETLYYVDVPTLKNEKRNTQFEITINPKLTVNEIEKERILWIYNTTHLTGNNGKTKIDTTIVENNNVNVSVKAGVPNVDEQKIDVKWVKEDYSKTNLTIGTSTNSFLEKALKLTDVMDNVSRKLEKIPFFKRMQKNENVTGRIGFYFDIVPFEQIQFNVEDKESNLYYRRKETRGGFDVGLSGSFKQTIWGLPVDKIPVVGEQLKEYISAGVYVTGAAKAGGEVKVQLVEEKYVNSNTWKEISKGVNPAAIKLGAEFGVGAEVKVLKNNDYLSFQGDANGKAKAEIFSLIWRNEQFQFGFLQNGVYLDFEATFSATFLGKKLEMTPYNQRIELIQPQQ